MIKFLSTSVLARIGWTLGILLRNKRSINHDEN